MEKDLYKPCENDKYFYEKRAKLLKILPVSFVKQKVLTSMLLSNP